MKNSSSSADDDKTIEILDNFNKISLKYSDVQSFVIDFKSTKSLSDLNEVLYEYGTSLENILGEDKLDLVNDLYRIRDKLSTYKPFLFLNKYGDVRNFSLEEFNNISNDENLFTY